MPSGFTRYLSGAGHLKHPEPCLKTRETSSVSPFKPPGSVPGSEKALNTGEISRQWDETHHHQPVGRLSSKRCLHAGLMRTHCKRIKTRILTALFRHVPAVSFIRDPSRAPSPQDTNESTGRLEKFRSFE